MRRSKILCTVGPASAAPETLEAMVAAGMSAVRLNFSHGTHEQHREMVARVRAVSTKLGVPLPILQDLQGPKIRVGDLGPTGLVLENGGTLRLTVDPTVADAVSVSYPALARDVKAGDVLLMDDGLLRVRVETVEDPVIVCRVEVGGVLRSRKGINLPGVSLSTPSLTEKDERDLQLGLELGVDYVALSFVRSADDVLGLRALIAAAGASTQIISKIEKPEAIEHLDDILAVSDGLMVARGDLGVELPAERVPLLQKHMVEDANRAGKLVIIATQMLDSMVRNPMPTRAEVSDVAAAVMQGADATMLSNETAAGAHPVEAVRMMARIVQEVETGLRSQPASEEPALIPGITPSASAIGRAAVQAARDLDACAIAVFTGSGRTAELVSDYRPAQPVLAFTPRPEVYRRMGLLWGVSPALVEPGPFDLERAASLASEQVSALQLGVRGEPVVLTLGIPAGPDRQTNLLWVTEQRR